MLAIATTPAELGRLRVRVRETALTEVDVVVPSEGRCVMLAQARDEWAANDAVVALRVSGWMAVNRPNEGARLGAWHEQTRPVSLPGELLVCPAWSEHSRADLDVIELGPGGFGSGHHPTTSLLVGCLAERVEGGESVLDVGCGSGVLVLCALWLGAQSGVGVDIDPAAVEALPRNAALNGFDGRVEATGESLEHIDGHFDIVLANIARGGIVDLADRLVAKVGPGGWLAVSGISAAQCDQVVPFLSPLVEVERVATGEWSALVLARL